MSKYISENKANEPLNLPFKTNVKSVQRYLDKNQSVLVKICVELVSYEDIPYGEALVSTTDLKFKKWPQQVIPGGKGILTDKQALELEENIIFQAQECETEITFYVNKGLTADKHFLIYADDKVIPLYPNTLEDKNIRAETGYTLTDYEIDETESVDDVIGFFMKNSLSVIPRGKALTLNLCLLMGNLYEFLGSDYHYRQNLQPRNVPVVIGASGVGKTTAIHSIFDSEHHQGSTLYLPSSTLGSISKVLQNTFSGTVICDDIRPNGKGSLDADMLEKVEHIVRTLCDESAAKKTAYNYRHVENRCLAVLTAESRFWQTPSTILRTLEIRLNPGECNFDSAELLIKERGKLNHFILLFLQYVAKQPAFLGGLNDKVKQVRMELREKYKVFSHENRILQTHAQIISFFEYALIPFLTADNISIDQVELLQKELGIFLEQSAKEQTRAAADSDYDSLICQEICSYLCSASANGELAKANTVGSHRGLHYSCTEKADTKGIVYAENIILHNKHKQMLLAYIVNVLDIPVSMAKLHSQLGEMEALELPPGVRPSQAKIMLNGREIKAIKLNFIKIIQKGEYYNDTK